MILLRIQSRGVYAVLPEALSEIIFLRIRGRVVYAVFPEALSEIVILRIWSRGVYEDYVRSVPRSLQRKPQSAYTESAPLAGLCTLFSQKPQ